MKFSQIDILTLSKQQTELIQTLFLGLRNVFDNIYHKRWKCKLLNWYLTDKSSLFGLKKGQV